MTQRDIRFRGWDGEKMLQPQDLSQSGSYWDWLGKKDVTLMQFTGLRDKNSNPIFEGDIIRHHFYPDSEVVFQRGQFTPVYNDESGDEWETDFWRVAQTSEVIGNAYENPELLEPKP